MDNRYFIVDELAREQVVEQMVANIAHRALTPDLKDLCQIVYEVMLEYNEERLVDLWENGQIRFFIARIILNQYRSVKSPFYKLFRRYQVRMTDISQMDFIDEKGT